LWNFVAERVKGCSAVGCFGVLRFAQDDSVKRAKAKAKADPSALLRDDKQK
jgi:hypothetical protein